MNKYRRHINLAWNRHWEGRCGWRWRSSRSRARRDGYCVHQDCERGLGIVEGRVRAERSRDETSFEMIRKASGACFPKTHHRGWFECDARSSNTRRFAPLREGLPPLNRAGHSSGEEIPSPMSSLRP